MTRSWYALPDVDVIAVAALWRPTAESGDCYTMVMAPASPLMADVHDRMPVILRCEDRERWLNGSADEALALCQTWPGALVADHTGERWAGGTIAKSATQQLL